MQLKGSFFVLAAVIASALASTVQDVRNSIHTIDTQVQALDTQIKSFTSPTQLLTVVTIQTDATNLVSAINSATTTTNAVTPKPVSESDGNLVLGDVEALEPHILTALSDIQAKRTLFGQVPVAGTVAQVHSDLVNLKTATDGFAQALINTAPTDLVATANQIKTTIDNALNAAIASFA